jgi:predicted Zn-dependent protease
MSFRADRKWIWAGLAAALLAMCAPAGALAQKPVMLDGMLLGYDLDLPDPPSIEQEVAAGKQQVEILRKDDATLDSDREADDYFNGLAARLLKEHQPAPLYPIVVHVSTEPITNAEALPGGQIVVFSHIFDMVGTEAELAGIIGHEITHQLNNDFLKFWHDYKIDRAVYGKGGVLEESQTIEAAADEGAVRLMYDAGWDPNLYVEAMKRLQARGVMARHGAPTFYSTHPRDAERIKALEAEIAGFAPKQNLATDSDQFKALKQRL